MDDKPSTTGKGRGRPKGSKGKTFKGGPDQQTGGVTNNADGATKSGGRKKGSGRKSKHPNHYNHLDANSDYAKSLSELIGQDEVARMNMSPQGNLPENPRLQEVADSFGAGMSPGSIPVYPREDWKAIEPSGELDPMKTMATNVRIVDTGEATPRCRGQESCFKIVQDLQKKHMQEGLYDINYNFLVGDDGSVYIGRGWDSDCHRPEEYSHLKGDCYDIAFIGDFNHTEVPGPMLVAGYNMIAYGHDKQKVKREPRVLRTMDFSDYGVLDKCLQNYFDRLYNKK